MDNQLTITLREDEVDLILCALDTLRHTDSVEMGELAAKRAEKIDAMRNCNPSDGDYVKQISHIAMWVKAHDNGIKIRAERFDAASKLRKKFRGC